ncbi:MAG: hypothetical protein A2W44_10585 [Acinetobacter sp. RIFCSPHIGHO2_12_41_5]|nr:MAG: hypothetical protein A2W44_10585 [Acinetobacter sp. RIFCSPHIGHO2_12_41_5]
MEQKDYLSELENLMKSYKPVVLPDLPRFYGGLVGYLSYDVVNSFEKIPQKEKEATPFPYAIFLLTSTLLIFDNLRQVIQVVSNVYLDPKKSLQAQYEKAVRKNNGIVTKLKSGLKSSSKKISIKNELKASLNENQFCNLVEKVKKYIEAGDVFQTVISLRYTGKTNIAPFDLYRVLRRLNPSPYMYYLKLGDMDIVGASPEVMVRLDEGKVELRPIAGTRRRGKTEEEDNELEKELQSDPKEMAEHVMLVDLGRNDLGRVCQMGSVKVDEQAIVERYSHVMHLVSHVSGKIHKGKNAFDVIRATFPAGTLTGAPKIRAMEIIEELEPLRRGPYGGCVGYIGFSGNTDMAITIRTAIIKNKTIFIQAGAGIVYNSEPRLEYKECQNKAMALVKALESFEL